MTKRLIEEWLPIAELGIESVRERTPMTPFPAPNRLHVWWARQQRVTGACKSSPARRQRELARAEYNMYPPSAVCIAYMYSPASHRCVAWAHRCVGCAHRIHVFFYDAPLPLAAGEHAARLVVRWCAETPPGSEGGLEEEAARKTRRQDQQDKQD